MVFMGISGNIDGYSDTKYQWNENWSKLMKMFRKKNLNKWYKK